MIEIIIMGLGLGVGFRIADKLDSLLNHLARERKIKRTVKLLLARKEYDTLLSYLPEVLTSEEMIENLDFIQWVKSQIKPADEDNIIQLRKEA